MFLEYIMSDNLNEERNLTLNLTYSELDLQFTKNVLGIKVGVVI